MIYLDNAATTQIHPLALEAMVKCYIDKWGNPSSLHEVGQEAKKKLDESRKTIADCIGAEPEDIIFTSGGTEADNLVINAFDLHGRYDLVSNVEHHAIKKVAESFDTFKIKVDKSGIVQPDELKKYFMFGSYGFVSIMMVNNELGIVNPIKELAEITHEHGAFFHTDAVQAVGHIPINVKEMGIDALSASAHKFGGPRGIGFLYMNKEFRDNLLLDFLTMGGNQEFGLRAGTENLPAIVGMATALKIAVKNMKYNTEIVRYLTEKFVDYLSDVKDYKIISKSNNIVSVMFNGVNALDLVMLLSENGVMCSTGSACNEGTSEPSHVLKATGLSDEESNSVVRFSFSETNTISEIKEAAAKITRCIKLIRGE